MSPYEISHEKQLQAQALTTVYAAIGGMQVYGYESGPGITIDDIASVRQTQRHIEPDGKKYLYTTNVTVSVSRVELT